MSLHPRRSQQPLTSAVSGWKRRGATCDPAASAGSASSGGALLSLQSKTHYLEGMFLRAGCRGPLPDIACQVRIVGQRDLGAVDVLGSLLVDQEEVVAARASLQVDVLAHLQIALGAEHNEPTVAPGRQPLWGVPVDADVALGGLAAQQHLPEVLHLGVVGMRVVGHGARHHLGGRAAGEPQELVDLMTGDVGDDPAEPIMVVEPVRAASAARQMGGVSFAVGAKPQGLHNLTDSAGANEFARTGHAADLEALGEGD